MTADITDRQRRALDMADAAPEDATDDNLDALLKLARHNDSGVRADAAQGVKMVARDQPDLVVARFPETVGLLHSHDPDIRTFGQDIVGLLGSERPKALDHSIITHLLAQGLTDENEFVRMTAARWLGTIGAAAPDRYVDPSIVDALTAKVEGDDRGATRGNAAESLKRIAEADPSTIGDRTIERLNAVVEREDVGERIETAIQGVETASGNRPASAEDGAETTFCPGCGTELDATPVPDFCRNCGQEL